MAILVTGGAGFIGSHTCAELLTNSIDDVVIVDNFSNSSAGALHAISNLAGRDVAFHQLDLRDHAKLDRVFETHDINVVIHFAAKKAVNESLRVPLEYFDNNIAGTTSLLQCMTRHGVQSLVFSSSCSIYGDQYLGPIDENESPGPTNPYARSKL